MQNDIKIYEAYKEQKSYYTDPKQGQVHPDKQLILSSYV